MYEWRDVLSMVAKLSGQRALAPLKVAGRGATRQRA